MIRLFRQRRTLVLIWAAMLLCMTLRPVLGSLFAIVAMLLFLAAAVLLPIQQLYVLLFAIMPYANIFKLSPNTTSLFTVAEFAVLALVIVRLKKSNKGFFFGILGLLLYMLLVPGESFSLLIVLKTVLGLGLFYGFCQIVQKRDLVAIGYLLAVTTILMMLLSASDTYHALIEEYLYKTDIHYDSSMGQVTKLLRSGGFLGDANFCSLLIIVTMSLLSLMYYYKEIGADFWLFFAALGVAGLYTYSKSYFLCVSALCVFLLVFVIYPKSKLLTVGCLLAFGALAAVAFSGRIEAVNVVLRRFLEGDLTTGRMELNRQYIAYIFSNPKQLLLGASISATPFDGMSHMVHNVLIELLYRLGVLGSILYVACLMACMKKHGGHYAAKGRRWANYLPLAFVLVMCSFLPALIDYTFVFHMMIAYAGVHFHALPEEKECKKAIVV